MPKRESEAGLCILCRALEKAFQIDSDLLNDKPHNGWRMVVTIRGTNNFWRIILQIHPCWNVAIAG